MEHGCCLNTIFSEFSGRRYEIVHFKVPEDKLLIYTAMKLMTKLSMQLLLETYTVHVEYLLVDFVLG